VATLFETKKVFFIILFLTHATVFVLMDPDYYLHLMAGKYIVEHNMLPHVDVFSYTMAGQPWNMHEWLFEILLYCIHSLAGENGIVLFTSGLGVLAFYVAFNAGIINGKKNYLSIVVVLLLFGFYSIFIQPRPQLITFLCYAIFLFVIFDYKYRDTLRFAIILPVLMLVWVNSHGAYIFGIAFLCLFIACEYLRRWMGTDKKCFDNKLHRLTLIIAVTILASAINPYFIKQWISPFLLMNKDAMSVISEWRSPDFADFYYRAYLFSILVFVVHYIYLKKRPDLTELVLPGSLIFLSFFAIRHIPLAILTIVPFALVTAKHGYEIKSLKLTNMGKWVKDRKKSGRDIGKKEYLMNGALLFIVVLSMIIIAPMLREKKLEKINSFLPVKAVNFIVNNGISGRFFNTYHYGGYLIYRLYPQQRVFIDIRAEMYGDRFMRDYTSIYFGADGWEKIFDKYKFDYVICENNAVIRKLLLCKGDFNLAYSDSSHSVLLRKLH